MNQRAEMPVDTELLRELLHLPESATIVGVSMKSETLAAFVIDCDDFPATPIGRPPPIVNAEFMPDDDGHPVFVNWKIS